MSEKHPPAGGIQTIRRHWGATFIRALFSAAVMLPLIASAQSRDNDDSADSSRDANGQPMVIFLGGGTIPPAISTLLTENKSAQEWLIIADPQNAELHDLLSKSLSGRKILQLKPSDPSAASALASAHAAIVALSAQSSPVQIYAPLLIDPAYGEPAVPEKALNRLKQSPGTLGLALSAGQVVVIRGRKIGSVGDSDARLVLPASVSKPVDRPVKYIPLGGKNGADLIALQRAAQARLAPEFPPAKTPPAEVPAGALLACGGGDLPESIWKRFIDLAGGPDAHIVFLTAAQPNPEAPNPRGLDRLKKLGCTHITVLTEHKPEDVRSSRFVSALREATGVWMAGGRQWRYVDAFEQTSAESLFRDVLKRGGVIGGSSAGAAIQSQYMVRGDPQTNKVIIGEGYERGLNFLPGTAIDVHVSERGRLDGFVAFIRSYPQLTGIAIDEKTGAEIRGHQLMTWGDGAVHIALASWKTPLKLISGDIFDLKLQVKK